MKTLCVLPFVGEFGWELFCHQGYLRKLSKSFDKTYVSCRKGHEILYKDFATSILSEDVDSEETDMWQCKNYKYPLPKVLFRDIVLQEKPTIIKPPLLRYDHNHTLDEQPLFNKFEHQDFVSYGKKQSKTYDIIIHARSKQNQVNNKINSSFRNWSIENWNKFAEEFKGCKIACIGTKNSAFYVGGDDLRGVDLETLCDVLASSTVIVGPSSGPIHLASLCKCPQITWYGNPYQESNKIRYVKDWNPFNVKVNVIRCPNWDIDVKTVIQATKEIV